ncbi:MAG: DUF1801 domain-containing protein [Acidobacteria bacterium]|nr:DUF1801 domain-containing protein [Acidobacteriota bacterium]
MTPDDYFAAQPEILRRIRAAVRKAMPDAVETISYNIPAYKIDGRAVLYLAGWKEHISIYPIGAAFADEVKPYVAGKGTLKFPLAEKVPVALIARIAKWRAAEARAKRKK